jgi:hypothetical protein
MKIVTKKWYWKLGFFLNTHRTYTSFRPYLFIPFPHQVPSDVIEHERIHFEQQRIVGRWLFSFLYLFAFPFLWNPWRFRWELEAYEKGSGKSRKDAIKLLRSKTYGWLLNKEPKNETS